MNCDCSEAGVNTEIPNLDCAENIGFIKRAFFTVSDWVFGPSSNEINLESTWVAALAANFISITPIMGDAVIPGSEARTEDSDATTLNIDENNVMVTMVGRGFTAAIIEAMQEKACNLNLKVGFITEHNKFLVSSNGSSPASYTGFDIVPLTYRLSSPNVDGTYDKVTLNFGMYPTWGQTKALVSPESGFYPLTEIRVA